jgi:hypothetical protein
MGSEASLGGEGRRVCVESAISTQRRRQACVVEYPQCAASLRRVSETALEGLMGSEASLGGEVRRVCVESAISTQQRRQACVVEYPQRAASLRRASAVCGRREAFPIRNSRVTPSRATIRTGHHPPETPGGRGGAQNVQ